MSGGDGELRLAPESIEALAHHLAELLTPREPNRSRAQLITAEEVARWWGISRRWVYDHADELGAHRPAAMRGDRRRCAAIALPTRFPCAAELWSVGKRKNGRGGAVTPPDPAPM